MEGIRKSRSQKVRALLLGLVAACALSLCTACGARGGDTVIIDVDKGPATTETVTYAEACVGDFSADVIKRANRMTKASYNDLPSWRGVTLENKSDVDWDSQTKAGVSTFLPADSLADITDAGFNFVCIPLDFRLFFPSETTTDQVYLGQLTDLDNFIVACLEENVHVCLSLCNTPGGYQEAGEDRTLFANEAQQDLMVSFWSLLAARYSELPNGILSFNLYCNPPESVSEKDYCAVMGKVIEAVRVSSPDRLMFADMLKGGTRPVQGLVDLQVAQSIRYYTPKVLTRYSQAMDECATTPRIPWPTPYINGYVTGSAGPYSIEGDFPAGSSVTLTITQSSGGVDLSVLSDGREQGSISLTKAQTAQMVTKTYDLPSGSSSLELYAGADGWVYIDHIVITTPTETYLLQSEPMGISTPSLANTDLKVEDGQVVNEGELASQAYTADSMSAMLRTYTDFVDSNDVDVMVLGFGCDYRCPYDACVAWASDLLDALAAGRIGWCYGGYYGPDGLVAGGDGSYKRGDIKYVKLGSGQQAAKDLLNVLKEVH